ncbi:unnamed protein product [Paramecium octaurelia]|uniref:Uncharacterized protein n=1 Tax=Paramecium octaurelia TaxID=43137 RepID=A0A8S1ULP0_PAROT|nr:unnamed protein product [Paramecium octaurelia]
MVNLSQYEIFIGTSLHNKLWRIISNHNTISHYQSKVKSAIHHKYPKDLSPQQHYQKIKEFLIIQIIRRIYSHQWKVTLVLLLYFIQKRVLISENTLQTMISILSAYKSENQIM